MNEGYGLNDTAFLLCRGGWPLSIQPEKEIALDVTSNYFESLFNLDNSENLRTDHQRKYPPLPRQPRAGVWCYCTSRRRQMGSDRGKVGWRKSYRRRCRQSSQTQIGYCREVSAIIHDDTHSYWSHLSAQGRNLCRANQLPKGVTEKNRRKIC